MDLLDFLLEAEVSTVYFKLGEPRRCWHNISSIYFQDSHGYYDRFGLSEKEEMGKYLENIVRVEKEIDGTYYPIWTKADGIVEDYDHFVKIRGRYYTIKQLELIFDQIDSIMDNLQFITRA